MLTVIEVGFEVFGFEKAALAGTLAHFDFENALFFIQGHFKISGFLGERVRPVVETTGQAFARSEITEIAEERIGKIFPILDDRGLGAFFFEEFEEFTVRGDKFGA